MNRPDKPNKMSGKEILNKVVFHYLNSIDAKIATKFQKASKMGNTELPDGTKSIQEMVDFFQVQVDRVLVVGMPVTRI